MKRRWLVMAIGVIAVATMIGTPGSTNSKVPSWPVSEHPRLISSPAERNAVVAKLTTPGTASATIWSAFLTNNFSASYRHYADGAFKYWVTGDTAAGQQAIQAAEDWMTSVPYGLTTDSSSFNESWYNYLDFLLVYDFAYDLLTPTQKSRFVEYLTLQAAKCEAGGPGYAPGNINTLWMFCVYASTMLVENETVTREFVDEEVFHGFPNTADELTVPFNATNIRINTAPGQAGTVYRENIDFYYRYVAGCAPRCIDWSPSGASTQEPAFASTYYVSYTFAPAVATWKSSARTAIEYHLNYQWRDGYYQGGINPYGSLVSELLPFLIEMLRRDTGIDYTSNPDVRKIVDNYLYSKLPSTNPGVPRRFNTINDTGSWTNHDADAWHYPSPTFSNYRSWLRPFVAWGTSAYANDPEGYDDRYLWLWTQAYRNSNGTIAYTPKPDWREALWINNDLVTPYVGTTAKPPATWPMSRYFRGAEVVYHRTEAWNQPDTQSAVMSLIAGNHNYQNEHDQGDAGSFTFFSHGEDWGIDPGYANGNNGALSTDHNLVAIDGTGYYAAGTYGIPDTSPVFGAYAKVEDIAQSPAGTALKANLTNAWSLSTTPFVERDERYVTMVNGSESSYVIVADDIKKDASNHSYQWFLHSGINNTISYSGNRATIIGARVGASLNVYSLGPTTPTWSQTTSTAGNLGTHPVLKNTATSTVNPYFMHLLLPTAVGGTAPTVTPLSATGGQAATIAWPNGTVDTILWRTTGSTVAAGSYATDARLTVIRKNSGGVIGVSMTSGRSLTDGGQPLISVVDGSAPVTISAIGSVAAVYAADASQVRLHWTGVTSAVLEDGPAALATETINGVVYINGAQPFSALRRNNGLRYSADFSNNYIPNLYRYNLDRFPAEQFSLVNGALELRATSYDWPSISKRDSTVWRRAGLTPNTIPAVDHGDAEYAWRWKFNGALGSSNAFRIYLRTRDRNAAEWLTNQDYLRLDFTATQGGSAVNTLTVGQRVNGTWASVNDNDLLTASLPAVPSVSNDGGWHNVRVRLLGNQITIWVDELEVINAALPTAIPTAPSSGYMQFRVVGATPVLIDDITVTSIDQSSPPTPTTGSILLDANGAGLATVNYGQGAASDIAQTIVYESAAPIQPTDDRSQLTVLASAAGRAVTVPISGAQQNLYHGVAVVDQAGNYSQLATLVRDTESPSVVTNLQAQ